MTREMKHNLNTEVREFVTYAEQYGFKIIRITQKNHIMLGIPGGGPTHVIPGSPSKYSWKRNAEGDIRRKARQWSDIQRRAQQKTERQYGSK